MEYYLEIINNEFNETILYCICEDYSSLIKEINKFLNKQTDYDNFNIKVEGNYL